VHGPGANPKPPQKPGGTPFPGGIGPSIVPKPHPGGARPGGHHPTAPKNVVDKHYNKNSATPKFTPSGSGNRKIHVGPKPSYNPPAKPRPSPGNPHKRTPSGRPGSGGARPKPNSWQKKMSCRYFDPVAQSFLVDIEGGIFVPNIDLFFSTKSTNQPVTVQIRTMQNGYPTNEIVPLAVATNDASEINVSDTGVTSTRFTFESPVFLKEAEEYAFVVMSNSKNYTMFTARMGQKTLDNARLISKQPYLGSMFKSQNAYTWTPEQNEDVKFKLNCCQFTTDTVGDVFLVNEEVPALLLPKTNPISTTASSGVITIHHRNHGMHSTSANVTIAGVLSGSHNGIAHTNINGTYTTIGNIKLDSYTVTAQNSDTATATGDVGGSDNVTATRNILFDVIQPTVAIVKHEDTELHALIRTTGGRSLDGSETEYSLQTASSRKPVALNSDFYETRPGVIASQINETNEMSGSKSFVMTLSLFTPESSPNLSPVIDTQRMSLHLIQNRLTNPTLGVTPDFVDETTNTGGSSSAKYITKPIILENSSTSLDIRLSANIRATSSVKMYYRATSAEDVRLLSDVAWVAFNTTGIPDKSVTPADDDETFREQQYSVKDVPGFTAFALKIVLSGTNSSYPPIVKDMRGIALAL